MTLYYKVMILCNILGVVAFAVCLYALIKKRLEINNIYFFFALWSIVILFEYYFLGENSYIHMDDEGDHFIPFYSYLANYHLGGQFGHHLALGVDVYAAKAPGGELFSLDRFLISVFPIWIAVLIHKFIVVAVGFSGTYLLCRRSVGSDVTTAAVIAALFTVSNVHLMVITYGVGAGLAFLPMAIYVFIVRADERNYFLPALITAVMTALYLEPTHIVTAMFAGLVLSAILFDRLRLRVLASFGMLLALELVNWGESMYAMYMIAPFTERGSDISDQAFNASRLVEVLNEAVGRTREVQVFGVGLVALLYLWFKKSSLRWRGTVALFGPAVFFVLLVLFPWKAIGLAAAGKLSHQYVFLASLALLLPLLAEAVRIAPNAPGEDWRNSRHLAKTLILATAVGMMVYFKAYNFANLLYHGGQGQYRDIGTLAGRTWGGGETSRVLTLRVRDLGPEPALAYGNYGLESVDVFVTLLPRQLSAFFRYGFQRTEDFDEESRWDPRQFVDWSKWVDGRYRVGEDLPLPLLRAANVGFLLSPIPMEADGISLVAGPSVAPMTKRDRSGNMLAYFRQRIDRLFDFNDLYVYSLHDPLPQVYAAKRIIPVDDDLDVRSFLKKVADHVAERPAVVRASEATPLKRARASLRVEGFEKVRDGFDARVSAPEGGVVVVNTVAMPFWSAEADGRSLPITSVNLIHMAVAVPPGTRKLNFRYHRPTLADAFQVFIN